MSEPLPVSIHQLFAAAERIREHAYVPYSHFMVGAALVTPDGDVYSGCNVENAAYPVGTCAEAGAIAAMVAGGGRRIASIAIVGPGQEPCMPCGACRQRIREFADMTTRIHVRAATPSGFRTMTMEEILPQAFGPGTLDQAERDRLERGTT